MGYTVPGFLLSIGESEILLGRSRACDFLLARGC